MASVAILFAVALSGAPQFVSMPPSAEAFIRGELELTRYQSASVDLNDDGVAEVIVFALDREYCGSGGCTMFVLTPTRNGYRVVTRTTVTRPPVRVLSTSSHGWRDLAVRVSGGGVGQPYDVALKFDGRSYPSNPSVAPRLRTQTGGRVVIK